MAARWITHSLPAKLAEAGTDCFRCADSDAGWVEKFGDDLLVCWKAEAVRDELLAEWERWSVAAGQKAARIFSKHLPRQNQDRVSPEQIHGPSGTAGIATEAGVKYALDFSTGYSVGLFLDQRGNRARLRSIAPKRVLNTFAYTCSFSVAAALAGAKTVSVDLSKKSLERGRELFPLNGLDPAGHRFIADDVMEVLPRLERREEEFDAIILDPPTFSRGNQGRRWQVEEHLGPLFVAALGVATKGAHILVSTNCTRLRMRDLELTVRAALKANRRNGQFTPCALEPDFPPGSGSTAAWVRLG